MMLIDHAAAARRHALHHRVDDVDVGEVLRVHAGVPGGRGQVVGVGALAAPAEFTRMSIGPNSFSTRSTIAARRRRRPQIGRDGVTVPSDLLRALEVLLRARNDGDAGAFGEKGLGAGEADALAAAGDQDFFSLRPRSICYSAVICGDLDDFAGSAALRRR